MVNTLMGQKEFYKALEDARTSVHSGAHPFSLAWANGELNLKQIGKWAVQHFYYIDPIPQQFAQLFCRLDDLEARQHLLENLIGEEMPDTPQKRHPDLLVKFGKACGIDEKEFYDAENMGSVLPSTRAMRSWIWELVNVRHLAESAAGIMVALEGQLPTLYPAYVEAMRKMGLNDDDMEFFHVHIEGDEEHAHVGLEITAQYSNTPELQKKAISAVTASTQMRWQMLENIFEKYVKNVPQAA
ncbi:MAG: iron-containing redox enzyme family protein [Pseudomonadota bacterium]|nr:iron-containing redox enzyme family protein [Pseudomonadota bacterium]